MIDYDGRVQLRYSYRPDPSPSQQAAPARAFGCARTVFNDALAARQAAYAAGEPYLSDAAMPAALTAAKKTPERARLAEVPAVVLQQALADLNTAYRNFFASATGKRKGPRVPPPRFRSRKDSRQSIRFTANSRFKVLDNGKLRLPKAGDVAVRWSRPLPAQPPGVTVIRDAAGRLFASFAVEVAPGPLPETERERGIDLGPQAAERPRVDVQGMRHGPRPGRERREKHLGRRTGGQAKHLWRPGKTGGDAGTDP